MCYNYDVLDREEGSIVQKRKYRIISLVLMITLFLTGIYLDTAARDAFFLCGPMAETAFCPKSLHTDINSLKMCGSEMFGEGRNAEQKPIELHSLLSLSQLNRALTLHRRTFWLLAVLQPFCQTSDGLVTDFMHQSDGKKRN